MNRHFELVLEPSFAWKLKFLQKYQTPQVRIFNLSVDRTFLGSIELPNQNFNKISQWDKQTNKQRLLLNIQGVPHHSGLCYSFKLRFPRLIIKDKKKESFNKIVCC